MKIFLSFLFLLNCLYSGESEKQKDLLRKAIAEKLSNKKLKVIGFGGSGTEEGIITKFALSFQMCGHLEIAEARNMILSIAKTMLEEINGSEKIRPYLNTHPFKTNDIEIHLFILDYDGRDNVEPYVGSVGMFDDKLMFLINDPENCVMTKSKIIEKLDW